jgi:hypothetical protein
MMQIYCNDYPIPLIYKMQIGIEAKIRSENVRWFEAAIKSDFKTKLAVEFSISDLKARIDAIERGAY